MFPLRTPATGVKQYIAMLLQGYAGDVKEDQRQYLETAYASNERQLNIVNDLLKVASVDSGKIHLRPEETDLVAMTKEVIAEQASKFKDNDQNINVVHTTPTVKAKVDKAMFRMVLENLIDNAHKYTLPGKNVEVKLTRTKDGASITIKDEGIGIAKKDIGKLFQKFSRINNSLSASAGGTGLGLYWVKRVVDLHEGTIEVESVPDEGTSFTVALPNLE